MQPPTTPPTPPNPPAGPPPGWHPDPHQPGQQRWWDGTQWTGHVTGSSPTGPVSSTGTSNRRPQPGRRSRTRTIVLVTAALIGVALIYVAWLYATYPQARDAMILDVARECAAGEAYSQSLELTVEMIYREGADPEQVLADLILATAADKQADSGSTDNGMVLLTEQSRCAFPSSDDGENSLPATWTYAYPDPADRSVLRVTVTVTVNNAPTSPTCWADIEIIGSEAQATEATCADQ